MICLKSKIKPFQNSLTSNAVNIRSFNSSKHRLIRARRFRSNNGFVIYIKTITLKLQYFKQFLYFFKQTSNLKKFHKMQFSSSILEPTYRFIYTTCTTKRYSTISTHNFKIHTKPYYMSTYVTLYYIYTML